MKSNLFYIVDGKEVSLECANTDLKFGENKVLSNETTDVIYGSDWYSLGYKIVDLFSLKELQDLIVALEGIIYSKLKSSELFNIDGDEKFSLINYANYVNDELHYDVVNYTRDLYPQDFHFDLDEYIKRISERVGMSLTNIDETSGNIYRTIVRINRPGSEDYNPPHKDVYESLDEFGEALPFLNIWIPIVGSTKQSSLPIAAGSHLYRESQIKRSVSGAEVGKNKYRVRICESWGGSNELTRPDILPGQCLVFTPHLVHGLAMNNNKNDTRVSLEFRLFREQ